MRPKEKDKKYRLTKAFLYFLLSLSFGSVALASSSIYTKRHLKNGLDVIAFESHKVPLITIVLAVKAGAMTEDPEIDGLTHLWEHMFFKGNRRLKNQEAFNKRIRELGIVYNGDTAAEKVRFYITLPSVYLRQGLQFMADAIIGPLLDKTEIAKERNVVLNEYDRNASHPAFNLHRLKGRVIYKDKYYLRDPLGSREVIEKATRKDLLRIKSEVIVPQNSAILIAGDFDPKTIFKQVSLYFSEWKSKKGWKPKEVPSFPPFPKSTDLIVTHPQAKNINISIIHKGPRAVLNKEDSFAADVLISLLNLQSGKFHKKYVDSNMAISASFSYYTQSKAGELNLWAESKPENTLKVKQMLLDEPKEWLKDGYFTQEQLESVRRSLLVGHKLEVNKPSEFVKSLAFWWAVTGLDYYDSYLDNLQKITLSDIRKFVRKYLIEKPAVTTLFLSSGDAKKIGVKDNTKEIKKQLILR